MRLPTSVSNPSKPPVVSPTFFKIGNATELPSTSKEVNKETEKETEKETSPEAKSLEDEVK